MPPGFMPEDAPKKRNDSFASFQLPPESIEKIAFVPVGAQSLKVDLSKQQLDNTTKGKAEAGIAPSANEIGAYAKEQVKLSDAYQSQITLLVNEYKSNPLVSALNSQVQLFEGLEKAYFNNMKIARETADKIESGKLVYDNDSDRLAAFKLIDTHIQAAKNALFASLDVINPSMQKGQKILISGEEATGHEHIDYLLEKMNGGQLGVQLVSEYLSYKATLAYTNALAHFETYKEATDARLPNKDNIEKSFYDAKKIAKPPANIKNFEDVSSWVEGNFRQLERLESSCSRVYSYFNVVETRWFGDMRETDWQDRKAYVSTLGNVSAVGLDLFGGPLGMVIAKSYFTYGAAKQIEQGDYLGGAVFLTALWGGEAAGMIKATEGAQLAGGAKIAKSALGMAGFAAGGKVMYDMGAGVYHTAQDLAYFGFTPQGAAATIEQLANIYAAGRGGHKGGKVVVEDANALHDAGVRAEQKYQDLKQQPVRGIAEIEADIAKAKKNRTEPVVVPVEETLGGKTVMQAVAAESSSASLISHIQNKLGISLEDITSENAPELIKKAMAEFESSFSEKKKMFNGMSFSQMLEEYHSSAKVADSEIETIQGKFLVINACLEKVMRFETKDGFVKTHPESKGNAQELLGSIYDLYSSLLIPLGEIELARNIGDAKADGKFFELRTEDARQDIKTATIMLGNLQFSFPNLDKSLLEESATLQKKLEQINNLPENRLKEVFYKEVYLSLSNLVSKIETSSFEAFKDAVTKMQEVKDIKTARSEVGVEQLMLDIAIRTEKIEKVGDFIKNHADLFTSQDVEKIIGVLEKKQEHWQIYENMHVFDPEKSAPIVNQISKAQEAINQLILRKPELFSLENIEKLGKTLEITPEIAKGLAVLWNYSKNGIIETKIGDAAIGQILGSLTKNDYKVTENILEPFYSSVNEIPVEVKSAMLKTRFFKPLEAFPESERMGILNTWMEEHGRFGMDTAPQVMVLMHIQKNLDAVKRLEEQRPGAVEELYGRYGIKFFGRYTTESLVSMYDNIGKRDHSKPLLLVLFPQADHNAAFFQDKETIKNLQKDFDVRVTEARNTFEARQRLEGVYNECGPVSTVVVGGHGSLGDVTFGHGYMGVMKIGEFLNSPDVSKYFVEEPSAILVSCSTGGAGGFADKATQGKYGNFTVWAPDVPAFLTKAWYRGIEGTTPMFETDYRTPMTSSHEGDRTRVYGKKAANARLGYDNALKKEITTSAGTENGKNVGFDDSQQTQSESSRKISESLKNAIADEKEGGGLLVFSQAKDYFSKEHVPALLEFAKASYLGFKTASNAIRQNPELFTSADVSEYLKNAFQLNVIGGKDTYFHSGKDDELTKVMYKQLGVFKPEHFEIIGEGVAKDYRNMGFLLDLEEKTQENPQMHEAALAAFEKAISENPGAAVLPIGNLLEDALSHERAGDWTTLTEAIKRGVSYPPDMVEALVKNAPVIKTIESLSEGQQVAMFQLWLMEGKTDGEKINAVERNLEAIIEMEKSQSGKTAELVNKGILTFWTPDNRLGMN